MPAPNMPITPITDAAERQDVTAINPAVIDGSAIFPRSPAKLYVPSAPRERGPAYAAATRLEAIGCWGAGAEASKNQCYCQRSDTVAHSEEQISNGRRGCAGCENPCSGDPPRHGSDRDLETRHHAGVERAQYADCRVAQNELCLPYRQQHVERIGEAIMQRVGAAGDPEGACFVSGRVRCRREGGDRHNSMSLSAGPSGAFKIHLACVSVRDKRLVLTPVVRKTHV